MKKKRKFREPGTYPLSMVEVHGSLRMFGTYPVKTVECVAIRETDYKRLLRLARRAK